MRVGSISAAYVKQQDVLLPTLTVRETLHCAADLRLPTHTTKERNDMVDDVIMELGLKNCANTRIGNNANKGCSGGEKRRTSVGRATSGKSVGAVSGRANNGFRCHFRLPTGANSQEPCQKGQSNHYDK